MNRFVFVVLLSGIMSVSWGQNTITIGILSGNKTTQSETQLDILKNEINAVLGQETEAIYKDVLYNNNSIDEAKDNYLSLLDGTTEVIISFGVVNTVMLSQEADFPIPTIIVGAVNNDLVNIPREQKTSGINNLTYLITPFSYKEDLDAFADLYKFQRIGILVDDYILDLLPLNELFNTYFEDKESSFELIRLAKESQIDQLFGNVDAVYLVSKTNLNEDQLEQLINAINQNNLPSLSGLGVSDVEKGVLATNQPELNFSQIFRRIALSIEALNNNVNASELPLQIDYDKYFTVNMATADQIGLPVNNSMLASMNLIEGTPSVNAESTYSLVDVMKGVLNNNLSLEAARKDIELSAQDVKASKSRYLPDVNANAAGSYVDPRVAEISNGENPEFSTQGNLILDQVIYSEEATANISVQKQLLEAQREDYNSIELDAMLDASVSYFNALILKTNVSIQNRNLQLTKLNLSIADQNLELGATGKSDVLRFRSQLAQNTQSLIEARNTLKQAYFQINQLLNNPIGEEIGIQDTLIENWTGENEAYEFLIKSLDDPDEKQKLILFFVEEAKRNAPEIKSIDFNTEATRRVYRLNDRGRFVPTLALQGNYNYLFSKSGAGSETPQGSPTVPDGTYNLGMSVSLPIFNQNIRNINRQSSLIQLDQLSVQKENLELSIEKSINDLILELTNQVANIEISAVNLEFSNESLELSQLEYRNGAIPVVQLLDAQNNFIQASLANATARYNYHLVSMQLQRAIGYFFEMNTEASNQAFVLRARQYIVDNN